MPETISKAMAYWRSLTHQLSASQGPTGASRVIEVVARGRLTGRATGKAIPVGVPMKALGGRELFVRPGTSDLRNASDYYRYNLYQPPPAIAGGDLYRICELGSNMGAALTALAVRYPNASLLGVEADPQNARLASHNVSRFGQRCAVVAAGIWDEDINLVVDRDTRYGEHGFSVRALHGEDPPGTPSIPALTIDTLLARHMPEGEIDYMHVSIEGTEPRAFAHGGEWPARVRSLRVEAHPELGYPSQSCIADLERLGYEAWADAALPEKWVLAVRP